MILFVIVLDIHWEIRISNCDNIFFTETFWQLTLISGVKFNVAKQLNWWLVAPIASCLLLNLKVLILDYDCRSWRRELQYYYTEINNITSFYEKLGLLTPSQLTDPSL